MSGRQLPAVTGKQVIEALAAEGWYVKRIRGSHHSPGEPYAVGAMSSTQGNHSPMVAAFRQMLIARLMAGSH